MERTEIKWIAGLIGGLVLVMFFLFSESWRNTHASGTMEDFLTVSMPRPVKEMILGFSLSGRNVRREIEMLAQQGKANTTPQTPVAEAKKSAKPKDDKVQVAKKAAQRREMIRRQREQAFRARIIQEGERYRRRLLEQQALQEAQNNYEPGFQKKTEKKNNQNANNNESDDKKKMDASEWKSLVLAQPTPENIQKMIQAFSSGEIDADTYYEIVEALVKNNSEETKEKGLVALTSHAHPKAFSLAAHIVSEMDAKSQKRLNDYMYSFNNNRTLLHLDAILKSNDSVAATAAAQVITLAIDKIKAGQNPTGNNDVRAARNQGQAQGLTLASYQRLIPTLQWLSTKQGSELSQWAQTLLSQLRSNSSPA